VIARWSPSGQYAASLGRAETTRLWRLDAEQERLVEIAALESGEEPGTVAFGADDTEVVHGTFGGMHRVSVLQLLTDTGELREQQAFDDFASGIKVIAPAPDGRGFVIAAHDGVPRLYLREPSGPSLQLVARLPEDDSGSHGVSWSPDGAAVIRVASQRDRFEVIDMSGCP
jgi:WD40 repeat protein